jgi:hypothetical protein
LMAIRLDDPLNGAPRAQWHIGGAASLRLILHRSA